MLAVLATKIRSHGEASVATAVGKAHEGFLISEPVVGRCMVIFRDPNGRRMVTTAIRRILTTEERRLFYVETENSVYRIALVDTLTTQADSTAVG